jgi:DTW domain-containing protein YfiP
MHPKERRDRSGTGTGRVTHLLLSNSTLHMGISFGADPTVTALRSDPRLFPLVLSPGPGARDLASPTDVEHLGQECGDRTPLLFVLDASWACAPALLEANPWLAELPHVSFSTGRTSSFSFRKQPRGDCLSTLEAVHEVLRLCDATGFHRTEPDGVRQRLMDVFLAMTVHQASFSLPGRRRADSPSTRDGRGLR